MPFIEIEAAKIRTYHCTFFIAEDLPEEILNRQKRDMAHQVVDKLIEEGMIKCETRLHTDRFGKEIMMSFQGIRPD